MSDDRQQVRRERTRRSRRQDGTVDTVLESNGDQYQETRQDLAQLDDIISTIVAPSSAQASVTLGDNAAHDVQQITNEERVRQFRQQGGE